MYNESVFEKSFLSPMEVSEKINKTIQWCLTVLENEGVYSKNGYTVKKVELVWNEKFVARGFHALYEKDNATIHQLLFSVSMSNNRLNINYSDEIWCCLYEKGLQKIEFDEY